MACAAGGDTFSPLAPILGLVEKVAVTPSFTVRMGEDVKPKCLTSNRINGASGICEGGKHDK